MRAFLNAVIFLYLFFNITNCTIQPTHLDNNIECTPSNFVGEWKYQSTNGVILDSIPDITITLSDDVIFGDIQIDGQYYFVKSISSCIAGDQSGILDQTYELISNDELVKRTTVLVAFGSTNLYKRI
jgi:hypothetical protein